MPMQAGFQVSKQNFPPGSVFFKPICFFFKGIFPENSVVFCLGLWVFGLVFWVSDPPVAICFFFES